MQRNSPRSPISIHALREEGDSVAAGITVDIAEISIHALREEGDMNIMLANFTNFIFLSTPSARRATKNRSRHSEGCRISIHALREEGDTPLAGAAPEHLDFYPRPPRGGRLNGLAQFSVRGQFLSTPSARRATLRPCHERGRG